MRNTVLAATIIGTAILAQTATAAPLYSQDFELLDDGATSVPGFTFTNTGPGRVIAVQSSSPNRVGSKSLMISDTETVQGGSPTGYVTFASQTALTVSFDTWIGTAPPSGGEIQFSLRGTRSSDGATEGEFVRIYFNNTDILARFGNNSGNDNNANTNFTLLANYALDTRYSFTITADATTDTYAVSINGAPAVSGRLVGNLLADNFSKFQFTEGGGSTTVRTETYYIDNILIPEPTSLATLAGIGAFGLLRRRRHG